MRRIKNSPESEEIILDVNLLAAYGPPSPSSSSSSSSSLQKILEEKAQKEKDVSKVKREDWVLKHCDVGDWEPSPDHSLLAFSLDTSGDETYDIYVINLNHGTYERFASTFATSSSFSTSSTSSISSSLLRGLPITVIKETAGDIVWGKDNQSLYYTTKDSKARPYKLWKHHLPDMEVDPRSIYVWNGQQPISLTSSSPGIKEEEEEEKEKEAQKDLLMFTEEDEMFWMGISKTVTGRFLICRTGGKIRAELRVLDLEKENEQEQNAPPQWAIIESRDSRIRYSVTHHGNYLYILTNKDDAINMKLMRLAIDDLYTNLADESNSTKHLWEEVIPYTGKRKLDYMTSLASHLVLYGREYGQQQVWFLPLPALNLEEEKDGKDGSCFQLQSLPMEDAIYSVSGGQNNNFQSRKVRMHYSSPVTPSKTYDVDLFTMEKTLLKQVEVPNFEASKYTTARLFVPQEETDIKAEIPISIIYSKEIYPDLDINQLVKSSSSENNKNLDLPVLLYGYGSYGHCVDPAFVSSKLVLLDRGIIYIYGHIRGGGEMGREWYEKEGKFLTKKNTFADFICIADYLTNHLKLTNSQRLAIEGRSAGGLLIGACINLRPELFKLAILGVPFVDVMNSMCDSTIPLTVIEWEEWGNPNEKIYFDYMSEYSPYDNIQQETSNYPSLYITGGLHDPRVAYWEPAKFLARIRARYNNEERDSSTKDHFLLKLDMTSGHFSASDRYNYLKETSYCYSYMIDQICGEK